MRGNCGIPVRVTLRIERTHIIDLLQINVGENEFMIAGIDDRRTIGTREDVGRGQRPESMEDSRLGAERHLLPSTKHSWRMA